MENTTHTAEDLKMMQSLPLPIKIRMTEERIRQWYQYWGGKVCVSFSGGKDSTVLMHIARGLYPDIPAVFSNTGLEYPEIQRFVKEYGNVDVVTPSMKFVDVVTQYGYPLIGKEVAEAIYYARRIRSQTGNVEREREREQQSASVPNYAGSGETKRESHGSRTEQRRINLTGQRELPCGGGSNEAPQNRTPWEQGRYGKTGAASRNWRAVRPEWWDYEPGMRWRRDLTGVNGGTTTGDVSMLGTLPKTKTHSSTSSGRNPSSTKKSGFRYVR